MVPSNNYSWEQDVSSRVFVHLVWTTRDRIPLLVPELRRQVHRSIEADAVRLRYTVLALDGMDDHIHVLVKIPLSLSISDLVKQVKGGSSHLANRVGSPESFFRWQDGYAALNVSAVTWIRLGPISETRKRTTPLAQLSLIGSQRRIPSNWQHSLG